MKANDSAFKDGIDNPSTMVHELMIILCKIKDRLCRNKLQIDNRLSIQKIT
jgi:deferrochelatase/peroxidase EfeB